MDSKTMRIFVREKEKGNKERYTILSKQKFRNVKNILD